MKKIFLRIAIALAIISLLLWFGGRWVLSFSTADYEGDIALAGIRQAVEITFDAKGIPQIWAETDHDMYFAIGWLHASERLFQMELTRRLVSGKLSELFGEDAYSTDLLQRKIGFARKAETDLSTLDPQVRNLLERYCEGINAWIHQKSILPPEFVILNCRPAEWKPLDCLAIGIYQTWYAHELVDRDGDYDRLINALGTDIADVLREHKEWSPATVHQGFMAAIFGETLFPLRMSGASNSWIVAPDKSTSGAAIHASDPHLPVNRVPAFWYLAGMHSREGSDILGVTIPGLPFVVMGHNQSIAFAFTVAAVDVIDYYREKRHPADSLMVLSGNGYRRLETIYEEIAVKGEETPRRVAVHFSSGRPVVESDSSHLVSIKWAGHDFNAAAMVSAMLKLQKAKNFSRFREIVTRLGALDVNWTYSDIQGNIGYQLGAPIPKRDYQETFRLLAAEDTTLHWKGYYELSQTPYLLNPAEGWLATCNNQVVSDQWPYEIPGFYDPYRITRAATLLSSPANPFSAVDFQTFQLDLVSGFSRRWKDLLQQGAIRLNQTDLAAELVQWDGRMSIDLQTPALFMLWWYFLSRAIFEDQLGEEWRSGRFIQEEVLSRNLTAVIDDQRTPEVVEDRVDIAAAALDEVLRRFGRVTYGDISRLTVAHPLSRIKLLDLWLNLNRGPFPMPGDKGTLNANFNHYQEDSQTLLCVAAPSMRFVLDWADVDGFTINTNLGQSGNPFSPHYDDFLHIWRNGERWNVPFSRKKVYQQRSSLLQLLPVKG